VSVRIPYRPNRQRPKRAAEFHDPETAADASKMRHVGRYIEAVGAILEATDGRDGPWLDAACGTGYGSAMIRDAIPEASEVIGIDRNAEAIAKARHRYEDERTRFYRMPIESARTWLKHFGPFRAALTIETLEHLDGIGAQRKWLAALTANLMPGGLLWIACPVVESSGPSLANPWHLWEPTEDEVRGMVEWCGMELVKQATTQYHSTAGEDAWQMTLLARKP